MTTSDSLNHRHTNRCGGDAGFTLIELLVAMIVGLIILGGSTMAYISQQKSSRIQRDLAQMQQNLRAAMYLIKTDLRKSGRDGSMSGSVGITNVEPVATVLPDNGDPTLYPTLTMTTYLDNSGDGVADITDPLAVETISYQVRDLDGNGRYELMRSENAGASWEVVIDGLDDIGFAFAYDADDNGDLDRFNGQPNNNVIWAIDTNGDNLLDTNVDNISNGTVDVNDDGDGDNWIDGVDGALATPVPVNNIRAVRIWMLARSRFRDTNYSNNGPFVLGHHIFRPTTVGTVDRPMVNNNQNYDQFRRVLLEGAVALANYERVP